MLVELVIYIIFENLDQVPIPQKLNPKANPGGHHTSLVCFVPIPPLLLIIMYIAVVHANHKYLLLLLPSPSLMWNAAGTDDYVNLGAKLSRVGDLNGDGYNDILSMSPNANVFNFSTAGKISMYFLAVSNLN